MTFMNTKKIGVTADFMFVYNVSSTLKKLVKKLQTCLG